MRKLANIAIVLSLYAGCWVTADFLLSGALATVAPDIGRWLWGVGALLIGTLAQLSWKVHEAKRVEGLNTEQRARVRKVTGLIGWRIYALAFIVFVCSIAGFASPYVQNTTVAHYMTVTSLAFMLASAAVCVVLVPLMQRDVQRFEDRAREEMSQRKAADALASKLKGS